MKFYVLTLFPELFQDFQRESLIGQAIREKKININLVNIRTFGIGKHRRVDDTPYGGGDGMLMRCEPLFAAFESVQHQISHSKYEIRNKPKVLNSKFKKRKIRSVYLTPQGKRFTQRTAERLVKCDEILLLCGRYEGVDQRVRDALIDEEISIGDYVLMGGELPAMVLMESVIRLIPGVIGKEGSHKKDSFSKDFNGKREYPQYTKPADFRGMKVPDVLLSGHHMEIEKWRRSKLR